MALPAAVPVLSALSGAAGLGLAIFGAARLGRSSSAGKDAARTVWLARRDLLQTAEMARAALDRLHSARRSAALPALDAFRTLAVRFSPEARPDAGVPGGKPFPYRDGSSSSPEAPSGRELRYPALPKPPPYPELGSPGSPGWAFLGVAGGALCGTLAAWGAWKAVIHFAYSGTVRAIASIAGGGVLSAIRAWLGGGSLASAGSGIAGGLLMAVVSAAGPALLACGAVLALSGRASAGKASRMLGSAGEYAAACLELREGTARTAEEAAVAADATEETSRLLAAETAKLSEGLFGFEGGGGATGPAAAGGDKEPEPARAEAHATAEASSACCGRGGCGDEDTPQRFAEGLRLAGLLAGLLDVPLPDGGVRLAGPSSGKDLQARTNAGGELPAPS